MNLLLLEQCDFVAENHVVVEGRRASHIHKFLKPSPGDSIRVGVLDGLCGSASIDDCNKKQCHLTINALDAPPPPKQDITLLLALPRPLMLKRILQHATSLGVKKIVLLNTAKVEKSYWKSSDLQPEILREQLLLGLEQAMDTCLPALELARSFKTFFNEQLPEHLAATNRWLLVPGSAGKPLSAPPNGEHCTLLIGPERGFSREEINTLQHDAGFEQRHLGQRILRVETAVTAAIARTMQNN